MYTTQKVALSDVVGVQRPTKTTVKARTRRKTPVKAPATKASATAAPARPSRLPATT
jgi:hypothetical protein